MACHAEMRNACRLGNRKGREHRTQCICGSRRYEVTVTETEKRVELAQDRIK